MLSKLIHHSVILALLMGVGCKTDTSSAAPIDQPEDPESPPKAIPMAEHFVQAEEIRDAIIAGRMQEARAPANWLLDNVTTEDMPVRWRDHVPKVRRNAKKIANAEELVDAAVAAGKLATACGDCHADIGVAIEAPERPLPLKDETKFAQMDRHAYAAERMWDGLIGPIDEAWNEGATMMRDAPLHGEAAPDLVKSLAAETHALATSAVDLLEKDRAETYSRIIITCAACHSIVDGP